MVVLIVKFEECHFSHKQSQKRLIKKIEEELTVENQWREQGNLFKTIATEVEEAQKKGRDKAEGRTTVTDGSKGM